MKRLLSVAMLCLFSLCGCQTDNCSESIANEGCSILNIMLPSTRTSLGEKVDGIYPVYWSEGDKISANGIASSVAEIDDANPSKAYFTFQSEVKYPLNILYPSGSSVVFSAEQSYVEGSFANGCAPMCGYVASKEDNIELKHLAGVLRFAVKADKGGVLLDRIVVTSQSAKLAGEFAVDCKTGAITPSESATNSVTYTLPSAFELSTTEENIFYVSLPAVEQGVCSVNFVEASGEMMSAVWESEKPLAPGAVREFAALTYRRGFVGALTAFNVEGDEFNSDNMVYGYVKDNQGNGVEGVAVSDGFSVAVTNAKGFYSIDASSDAWYIYISTPAEYEIERGEYGLPCFYQKYDVARKRYDFELTPLEGGKEDKFALFIMTDVHITTNAKVDTFKNSIVPHLNKQYEAYERQGVRAYGVMLGDNITNYDNHNTSAWRDDILGGLALSNLPIFSTFGNHDCCYFDASSPLTTDERSSTYNLKAQREFEDMFGPVNYSFNRGDTHIICMRNILYTDPTHCTVDKGFTREQYEWVKQDLANVPTDKMVVLCLHMQLYNDDAPYCQEILSILDDYKEGHIMSGHGHVQRNLRYGNHNDIYEHITCSLSGPVWTFDLCGDGTPCGYQIFLAEGAHIADWYYISYLEGRDTRDSQFHLYRGDARTGAAISGTNSNGTKGYYQFNFSENTILANVYNADSRWKISVYEDGVYSGEMERLPGAKPAYSELIGDGSYENPFRYAEGVVTGYDFYVGGFHLGLKGRQTSHSGAWSQCVHMYKYELKNKDAKVKVVVKDFFGKEYTTEEFIDGTTYTF